MINTKKGPIIHQERKESEESKETEETRIFLDLELRVGGGKYIKAMDEVGLLSVAVFLWLLPGRPLQNQYTAVVVVINHYCIVIDLSHLFPACVLCIARLRESQGLPVISTSHPSTSSTTSVCADSSILKRSKLCWSQNNDTETTHHAHQ